MWSKISDAADNVLNRITMYRLVLYVLAGITAVAVALAGFQILPFGPLPLLFTVGCLVVFSKVSNDIFSYVFEAPANIESVYITALILGLIISPAASMADLIVLFWAALLATASKYILALGHKHLFNPAAVAVVLTAAGLNASASWWIGNAYMALPVAVGSLLVIRKIRHTELINSFLFTVIFLSIGLGLMNGTNILLIFNNLFLHSSLLFFTGIMLTEPLTAPSEKNMQFIFGSLVGFLFVPQVHIGPLYFTPEQALVIGNVFAYLVSPDQKLILPLMQKVRIAPDTVDFIFPMEKKISFLPGQYMEWTLAHEKTDSRGSRRFFTLASSPTEKHLRISVKFPPGYSSYKRALLSPDAPRVVASGLAGDFTLPVNQNAKLVFIAGGIGITPFRSMIKYLLDTGQKRDIVLLFSNRNDSEIVYRDVFDRAATTPGFRIVYHLTGVSGHFDKNNLPQLVPDFTERLFYISGPHRMVSATERLLRDLGVSPKNIKTDYFPGFV